MRVHIVFEEYATDGTYGTILSALSEFAARTTGEGIAVLSGPREVSLRVEGNDPAPINALLAPYKLSLDKGQPNQKDMLGRTATSFRLVPLN